MVAEGAPEAEGVAPRAARAFLGGGPVVTVGANGARRFVPTACAPTPAFSLFVPPRACIYIYLKKKKNPSPSHRDVTSISLDRRWGTE